MKRILLTATLALGLVAPGWPSRAEVRGVLVYSGMCDASAGVAVDVDRFLVANDEDNVLRLFSRSRPGGPLATVDLSPYLALKKRSAETDLEGAARIGDRVYWITSHGRNAAGKAAPSRHRFIATQIHATPGTIGLQPVGRPYENLVDDLNRDARYAPWALAAASRRAPKEPGALNIEGLCDTGGGGVWIGFRNPIPGGRALLAGLLNPKGVGLGEPARFDDPVLLDLEGLGVRDLARVGDRIWIIAGPFDGGGPFQLYEWRGRQDVPRRLDSSGFGTLKPEALLTFPGSESDRVLMLSDDGSVKIDGVEAKKLKDPRRRRFRALPLDL